jgi:hypothetical protein
VQRARAELPRILGETLDMQYLNILVRDMNTGSNEALYYVTDASRCSTTLGGWYLDDNANPKAAITCPATCETIAEHRRVEFYLGCARRDLPSN